jgi:hypothetical protein
MNLSEVCDALFAYQTKKKNTVGLATEIMANRNTYITSKISRNCMNISLYFKHVIGYARFTLEHFLLYRLYLKYCVLNLVVGRKILWYFKILRGL